MDVNRCVAVNNTKSRFKNLNFGIGENEFGVVNGVVAVNLRLGMGSLYSGLKIYIFSICLKCRFWNIFYIWWRTDYYVSIGPKYGRVKTM